MTKPSNMPSGIPDPADLQEMALCYECAGLEKEDCIVCDGLGEIPKHEFDNYKLELQQDSESNQ